MGVRSQRTSTNCPDGVDDVVSLATDITVYVVDADIHEPGTGTARNARSRPQLGRIRLASRQTVARGGRTGTRLERQVGDDDTASGGTSTRSALAAVSFPPYISFQPSGSRAPNSKRPFNDSSSWLSISSTTVRIPSRSM
ncbi:hypothetical protein D8S78_03175 [Natrialba swarupiae]|nr:hypothetical protein [Natrialba swarupiae]